MRISLTWLRELVDFDLSPEDIGEALTLVGFEVEDIEDRSTWADGVIIGRILEAETHPNADRLRVCKVDIGQSEPATIVCGAANARTGLTVPVAVPGVYLPAKDLTLTRTELRGVPSEGMICSLAELGLEKKSDGIHEFSEAHPVGTDVRPILGLEDIVLDLTSTANRADALSMVGIAREVAALTRNPIRLPIAPTVQADPLPQFELQIAEAQACPAYSGTLIRNVKIGPSPTWLQQRLEAAGTRAINNVVDITNLVLLEWGQPLHAFDWACLQQVMDSSQSGSVQSVGVRFANAGETLKTLDGSDRSLQPSNLIITAADHPVAFAGVMGGEATEVSDQSQDIFLEAALFDPVVIRRSARAQGLRTEASARYERGVDVSALMTARDRAIALILELAGGEVVAQTVFDERPQGERILELRLTRMMDVLGDDIRAEEVETILPALGFELSACELRPVSDLSSPETPTVSRCVWQVKVPPYRLRDVDREIDLIEEFARLYGYDQFPETLPPETAVGALSLRESSLRRIREVFRGAGLTELMHISLCSAETGVPVVIANPMSPEFSGVRQDLLPGLIEAAQYNYAQGNPPLNGFEMGRVYGKTDDGYREADHIGGIISGNPTQFDWQHQSRDYDWYAAKGILVRALDRLGLQLEFRADPSFDLLHPGRTASLYSGDEWVGKFGQLHPRVQQAHDLPTEVFAFELDVEVLLKQLAFNQIRHYRPFSSFPASDRDIAFFAPLSADVATLEIAIRDVAGELLESVQLFDDYRGQGVPDGQRSLGFRLIYRAPDRTLTDQDVEGIQKQVRQHLETHFGVILRS